MTEKAVNKLFRYLFLVYYILLVWLSKHEILSLWKFIAYIGPIMTQHIKPLNYFGGISTKGSKSGI